MKVRYEVPDEASHPLYYSCLRTDEGKWVGVYDRQDVVLDLSYILEVRELSCKFTFDPEGYLLVQHSGQYWENARQHDNDAQGHDRQPEEWMVAMQKICDALTHLSEFSFAKALETVS